MKQDYVAQTWDLFVDSIRVFQGLGMRPWYNPVDGRVVPATEFSRFSLAAARSGGWYLDDIAITNNRPAETLYGGLQTADIRVSLNSDDAEEKCWNGGMELDGGQNNDLDMGYQYDFDETPPREESRIIGIAFTNGIAQGSAIHRAYLQFCERNSGNDKDKYSPLRVESQAADNASTFASNNYNITSRARTGHQVAWSPPGWYQTGQSNHRHASPDLAILIHDVTARAGWQPGNRLALIISDELSPMILSDPDDSGRRREAIGRELDPAKAPLLHVEWAAPLP